MQANIPAIQPQTHCGHVAIVGRPNVGKSTLLNALIGVKISAIANKPQTTWHNILGILTEDHSQMIFIDTPGMHLGKGKLINKILNENARSALNNVDLVVFVIDNKSWHVEENYILNLLKQARLPCILAINKIDKYKNKTRLLPLMESLGGKYPFAEIIPISAKSSDNLATLKSEIRKRLPIATFYYPEDQISDRNERFFVTELIREQVFYTLQQELPYCTYVELEAYNERQDTVLIAANLWVSSSNQKTIIIGNQGSMLKKIGIRARLAIERFLGKKVYLKLWVKNKAGWQNDPKVTSSFQSTQ